CDLRGRFGTVPALGGRARAGVVCGRGGSLPIRRRLRHAVAVATVAVAPVAPVATVAPVAPAAATPLRDLPDAVGQERHLAGDADLAGHRALLLRAVAGDTPGADLGPLRHEPPEKVDVLVVDPIDALGGEDRCLLLDRAAAVGRLGLLILVSRHLG